MTTTDKDKSIWWLYQARRICTQDNAGGGQLRVTVRANPGQVMKILWFHVIGSASAGASLSCFIVDEDDIPDVVPLGFIAAGALRSLSIPTIGTAANTSANYATSENGMIGPGMGIYGETSVATVGQTLTITVMLLMSTRDVPIWSTAQSVGTPNLGASSISAANTLQPVLI